VVTRGLTVRLVLAWRVFVQPVLTSAVLTFTGPLLA
jgi:hypothetical protein